MESLQKNIQLMLEFLKAPFFVLHICYYTLMTFLRLSVILLSMLKIECDQASDLWQQLELASEVASDLWGTVDQGKKRLIDFNAGKTQLVSFEQTNNTVSIDVEMDEPVLEEKIIFEDAGVNLLFQIGLWLLHYLYCWNCLRENWSLKGSHVNYIITNIWSLQHKQRNFPIHICSSFEVIEP